MNLFRTLTANTPDGDFHMILDTEDVVVASGFGTLDALQARLPEVSDASVEHLPSHPYQQNIAAYFSGNFSALDSLPKRQQGSGFQSRVWSAISAIPAGSSLSYKELAGASGNEAAIRAAGTICGLNKLILLVPCHRVIKSDGGIGNYLYGTAIKRSLLRHEGLTIQ